MRLYNLTPLGAGWGWKLRLIEIVGQTLSLILLSPVIWVHNITGKIIGKALS